MLSRAHVETAAFACILSLFGCKSPAATGTSGAPSASAPTRASAAAAPAPNANKSFQVPIGPRLAILAGTGVGPIRFGATVATIERLMEAPCELKTADVCRYMGRGVEFLLENGVTKTVHIYRAGRPAGKDAAGQDAEYGFFRGAIPPDLQLGMVPAAIQEHLGQAQSIDKSDATGPGERVETHHYRGLTIVFDRLENGNLVMAEMIVFKPPVAEGAASATASAPTPTASTARPAPSTKH